MKAFLYGFAVVATLASAASAQSYDPDIGSGNIARPPVGYSDTYTAYPREAYGAYDSYYGRPDAYAWSPQFRSRRGYRPQHSFQRGYDGNVW